MKALGSVAAVIAAIVEEADAEVEALEREAAGEIAALPRIEIRSGRPEDSAAVAAARERARVALAHEDWEDAREALGEREAWIARAVARGRSRLQTLDPTTARREQLAALALEAVRRLPAGPIEMVVSAADAPLVDDEWRVRTFAPSDPPLVTVLTGPVEGGLIARTADGRAIFDNTWPAREERLQSTWRAALADLYEEKGSGLFSGVDPHELGN